MKMLRSVWDALFQQARTDYPVEACGYLGAVGEMVVAAYPLTNVDGASDHFSLEPKEQLDAVREMRAKGQRLMGVYHSHGDSPPWPSPEDVRLAYDPEAVHVIVSIGDGSPSIAAFRIRNGEVSIVPVEWVESTGP